MRKIHQTMREEEITTEQGPKCVGKFSADRRPIEQGVISITKGLLAQFYQGFNYHGDTFMALHINSATLAAGQAGTQQKMIEELETKTQGEVLGNHGEFRFWRKVEREAQRGVWLLRFYDALNFIVFHHRSSESYDPVPT